MPAKTFEDINSKFWLVPRKNKIFSWLSKTAFLKINCVYKPSKKGDYGSFGVMLNMINFIWKYPSLSELTPY